MSRAVNKDKAMAAATKTVNVVECCVCKTMHLVDSEGFVVIYGNVSVGMKSPVIDENIDERGKVSGSNIYCRKAKCTQALIHELAPDAKLGFPGSPMGKD